MSSMSGGQKTDSVNSGKLRTEYGNNRMIVNDGTDDILLAGQDNDGDIVFKVAQPGFDVKTASDEELAFSSQFNTLKVVSSGTVALVKPANTEYVSTFVTLPLGRMPAVLAYYVNSNGYGSPLPYSLVNYATASTNFNGKVRVLLSCAAGAEGIEFSAATPNDTINGFYIGATTFNFKYYIFAETIG